MHRKEYIHNRYTQPGLHRSMLKHIKSCIFFLLGESPASEFFMYQRFGTLRLSHLHTCFLLTSPMKMKQCSETSAHKFGSRGFTQRKNTTFKRRRRFEIKNIKCHQGKILHQVLVVEYSLQNHARAVTNNFFSPPDRCQLLLIHDYLLRRGKVQENHFASVINSTT